MKAESIFWRAAWVFVVLVIGSFVWIVHRGAVGVTQCNRVMSAIEVLAQAIEGYKQMKLAYPPSMTSEELLLKMQAEAIV